LIETNPDNEWALIQDTLGVDPNTSVEEAPAAVETTTETPAAREVVEVVETSTETPADTKVVSTETPVANDEALSLRDIGEKAVEEAKDYAGFKSFEEMLEDYNTKKTQLEELTSSDPFSNEEVKALNDYIAKGGDLETFVAVQKVDTSSMDPLEKVVLAMKWQNPGMDEADIRLIAEEKYSSKDEFGDEDPESREFKVKQAQLKLDAAEASKFIEQHKVNSSTPKVEMERVKMEQAEEARRESWNEPIAQTIGSINAIEMKIGDRKFKYPVAKHEIQRIEQQVSDMVYGSAGYAPTKENIAEIKGIAEKFYKAEYFEDIVDSLAMKLSAEVKVEGFKEKHNPSGTPSLQVSPNSKVAKTAQEVVDEIFGMEMGN
jgi:hypothetical protein